MLDSELTGIYVQDSKWSGLSIITVEKLNDNLFILNISNEGVTPNWYHTFLQSRTNAISWVTKEGFTKIDELSSIEGEL